MFCPECGEVIGSGPLDVRRAGYARRRRGVSEAIGAWIGRVIGKLAPPRGFGRRRGTGEA